MLVHPSLKLQFEYTVTPDSLIQTMKSGFNPIIQNNFGFNSSFNKAMVHQILSIYVRPILVYGTAQLFGNHVF